MAATMTLKQLFNLSVEDLEKMTDTELNEHIKKSLVYTRLPSLKVEKPEDEKTPTTSRKSKSPSDNLQRELARLASKHGIQLDLPKELKL